MKITQPYDNQLLSSRLIFQLSHFGTNTQIEI